MVNSPIVKKQYKTANEMKYSAELSGRGHFANIL